MDRVEGTNPKKAVWTLVPEPELPYGYYNRCEWYIRYMSVAKEQAVPVARNVDLGIHKEKILGCES